MATDEREELIEESFSDEDVVRIVGNYRREADQAATVRLEQNKLNFDFYHLRQDFSHKQAGQSVEFLPKQMMAVEQITSFMQQGLVDLGDWFSVSASMGNEQPMFSDSEARRLMGKWLGDCDFYTFIGDAIKSGLLASLMIAKVGVKGVPKAKYRAKKVKAFVGKDDVLERQVKTELQADVCLIRPENFRPDPTGEGLYVLEDIEMDYWQLKKLARENPDVYDVALIDELGVSLVKEREDLEKKRETDQDAPAPDARMRVKITEVWGTLVNEEGEVLYENGVCAVANDAWVIRKPSPNPFWHQRPPYVVAPIVRVPWSVWHRALMDAPTHLNKAENELYNLILDSGLMSVFGVRQIRPQWLENAEKISGGIGPNTVLVASPSCPPGQKVMETVSTGTLSQEALQVLNLTNAEFSAASLTNDLRMGVMPTRAVKATEVVAADQSINSVFSGVAKNVENTFVQEILEMLWAVMMQHTDSFETSEYEALLGKDRAETLSRIKATERFASTVDGHDFRVFGITQTMNKVKDFRKLTSFLQTIAGVQTLADEFSRKYDFAKLLGEIMKSLDIDEDKIKLEQADEMMNQMGAQGAQGAAAQGGAPDMMSQMTQMAATQPESAAPEIPRDQFAQGFGGAQ